MEWQFPPYTVFYVVAILALPLVAFSAWQRHEPGVRYYALLMLAMAVWSGGAMLETASIGLEAKNFFIRVQYIGVVTGPLLWLMFTLEYTSPGVTRRAGIRLLWLIPAVTMGLVVTNAQHGLVWTSIDTVPGTNGQQVHFSNGPVFWLKTVLMIGFIVAGVAMLVRARLQHRPGSTWRLGPLLVCALIVMATTGLYLAGRSPLPNTDPTPITFAAIGLVLTYAMFSGSLFEIAPSAQEQVLDSMEEGLLLVDGYGRVIDANPAAERMLGLAPDSAVGMTLAAALAGMPAVAEWLAGMPDTEGTLRDDANGRTLEVHRIPLSTLNVVLTGDLILLRDTTAETEAQNRLIEVLVEQERIQLLAAFIQEASHAFRSPLSSINLSTYLAERAADPADRARQYRAIEQQVLRMVELLDHVLLVASLDRGRTLEFAPLDLMTVLTSLSDSAAQNAAQRGLQFRRELPAALPLIEADGDKLRVALEQVLNNALRFTPAGGLVTLRAQVLEDGVEIEVADTGIGMSEDVRLRAFDRFFRAERSDGGQGFGLGLTIAHQIARAHEGRLELHSAPGEGTRVLLWVPLQPHTLAVPERLPA